MKSSLNPAGSFTGPSLSARRAWIEIGRPSGAFPPRWSLSARRAWIEIYLVGPVGPCGTGRSPQGERGLKSLAVKLPIKNSESLSARRAWIEIGDPAGAGTGGESRSPQGERGLKSIDVPHRCGGSLGRSPQGERGLKFCRGIISRDLAPSLSARRAWIEIFSLVGGMRASRSLSARRAWIEI